jgi:hypothetical protein
MSHKYRYKYTDVPSVLQGDVPDEEAVSFLSGYPCRDFHHIFGKTKYYRRLSEQYGFWIWLTRSEHDKLHHTPAGKQYERTLKQQCQELFELEHPRSMFIRLFGKSYL